MESDRDYVPDGRCVHAEGDHGDSSDRDGMSIDIQLLNALRVIKQLSRRGEG